MNHPTNCPHCNAVLDNGDIYDCFLKTLKGEENAEAKAREMADHYGANPENPRRFSRIVGVYDWNLDRTVYYECPDCKERIER